MCLESKDGKVEAQPVEGPAKVSTEGVFVQMGEAGEVGEVDASAQGEDRTEEFHEEVALALGDVGLVNGRHLYEDKAERSLDKRLCEHGSWGLLGGTTDLRPIAFTCKPSQNCTEYCLIPFPRNSSAFRCVMLNVFQHLFHQR